MRAFTILTSCPIPLPHRNVDTDQIIPARFLKVTDKSGLVDGLFERWRYAPDGKPDMSFPLNQEAAKNCSILVAGDNFGSGSSREHAPWALIGWGIRAVISTSIADIFRSNALKNGLLPVIVDEAFLDKLFQVANAWFQSGERDSLRKLSLDQFGVTISLADQTVTLPDKMSTHFEIDPFSKACLLQGVDSLGYLLKHQARISAFERSLEY